MQPHSTINNLLSREQLALLGEVAVYSADLEWMIGFVMMWLLRLNGNQTSSLIGGVMLKSRIELLEKVGMEAIKKPRARKTFGDLCRRMNNLASERNTVIHGTWAAKGKDFEIGDSLDMEFGYRPAKGVTASNPKNKQKLTVYDLKRLAQALQLIRGELFQFAQKQWAKGWRTQVLKRQGWNALRGLTKT